MSNNTIKVCAVDDGHFGGKNAVLDHEKKISNQFSPTLVSTASSGFEEIGDRFSAKYTTKHYIGSKAIDKEFTVLPEITMGQQKSLVSTNNPNYQTSAPARVMVNHMLSKMGCNDTHQILLVASSPVERFYKNGVRNEDYIKDRLENFKVPVYKDGQRLPEIVHVVEVPEAIAAFYNDLIVYEVRDGTAVCRMNDKLLQQSCLYIDMGGRTIDTGVIGQGSVVVDDCKTFEDSGMLAIHSSLQKSLKTYRDNISRQELDEVIKTKKFSPDLRHGSNRQISVDDIVDRAVEGVIEDAIGTITQTYNFKDFNRIVFTGGSSARLEQYIKQYLPEAYVSPSALYDNVNGMLKYGLTKKKEYV
ncbi:plasmid segregation protein ParM domain-containing protein [Vibrio harveyi]|uniref:plasmid segregation protein ParM domain-containing protein n=1 Tax=Vibrio harveyi TaxID=669 RepID=UPI003BB52F5E|nr:ParM/StbA family protein [Vibrio harveyi]